LFDWFLETFELPLKHVTPLELSPFDVPVLVYIDMTVSLAADINEQLAEMKRWV